MILKVQYFTLSGKPSFEIFCWVIFLDIGPFTTNPCEVFQSGCRQATLHISLWILRVSFLKVLQPFKKSDFPAILGNVLQILQVIRPFSNTSQAKSANHESSNCLDIFFCCNGSFWFHSYSLTRRTGVHYFNIVNG